MLNSRVRVVRLNYVSRTRFTLSLLYVSKARYYEYIVFLKSSVADFSVAGVSHTKLYRVANSNRRCLQGVWCCGAYSVNSFGKQGIIVD